MYELDRPELRVRGIAEEAGVAVKTLYRWRSGELTDLPYRRTAIRVAQTYRGLAADLVDAARELEEVASR